MQIDKRAQILLKTLIECYIADGQPVGSRALSQLSGLALSPATIRHVMADLEAMGLIASPHTSSGRIPTPLGYRFFVDTLLTIQNEEILALQSSLPTLTADNPQQKIITHAAQLLSSLSHFAGLVTTPRTQPTFEHIEFLRLSDKRILLVMVLPGGDIQNRLLLTEVDYTPIQLIEAGNYINQHFSGMALENVHNHLQNELTQLHNELNTLLQKAVKASSEVIEDTHETVVISGERNLLDIHELATNMASLRQLFDLFEQKTHLIHLLESSSQAEGVQIFIGGESDLMPIDDMSVVTSNYQINGQVVGTLAVIGPTRMAYKRVIPIVDMTAKLLSQTLSY